MARAKTDGSRTITNLHQLQLIARHIAFGNIATYRLGVDIDASETAGTAPSGIWSTLGLVMLGDGAVPFSGVFDGQGHVIRQLFINRTDTLDGVGLFARVVGQGPFGGSVDQKAQILNLGIVGGSINGLYNTGSIAGEALYADIINSYADVSVSGRYSVGGLVGNVGIGSLILQSHASGNVAATVDTDSSVGGLVGVISESIIRQSYATGTVSGQGTVGGFVGSVGVGTVIDRAYATGAVTGQASGVGGFAGYIYASDTVARTPSIARSYATGAVTGQGDGVGGLIGQIVTSPGFVTPPTITQSYATGRVTGQGSGVGGFIGTNTTATITNSYWDVETTGQATGAGSGGTDGLSALTTAQARQSTSYAGWDFAADWYQTADLRPIGRWEAAQAGSDGVATIVNAHQLQLAGLTLSGSYRLAGDLDAAATAGTDAAGIWGSGGFAPLGRDGVGFTGRFDGRGHAITGLTVNRPQSDDVGLFGVVGAGGVVSNLALTGASSLTGGNNVGSIAGRNAGTITQSYSTAAVIGQGHSSGGLAGVNSGTIGQSYAGGTVTGLDRAGGLVGTNAGTILQTYATGAVTAQGSAAGGLAGRNDAAGTIGQSHAGGVVTAQSGAGGLVGANAGAVASSYWDTDGSGQAAATGSGDATGMTGLSASAMRDAASFAGFDAAVWAPAGAGAAPRLFGVSGVVGVTHGIVYGDDPAATPLTLRGASVWNSVGGLVSSGMAATMNAGAYANALDVSSVSGTFTGGGAARVVNLGGTVTPATLTVTAGNGTMVYGGTVPTLGYSLSGWKNGQTDALLTGVTVSTDATATSNVGTGYASTASGGTLSGAAAGNYTLSYVTGGFSVTPATLTVTPTGTMTYGSTSPTYGFTAAGWKNGQTDGLLSGLSYATDATAMSNVGTGYASTASGGTLSGAAAGNYTLSYATGGFSVTPASLTVTPTGTMTYGSTSPIFGFTAAGWKNGQTDALLNGLTYTTDATATSNVGTGYASRASGGTLSGAAAGNYTLNYATGGFSVTPAILTVRAGDTVKLYDGLAFSGGTAISYDGFVNGETTAVLSGTVRFGGNAQGAVNAGRYTVSVSGLTSGNYDIRYADGELVVGRRLLTVAADDAVRLVGVANPALTYRVVAGGLVGNDRIDGRLDTAATPASAAGTYAITLGSLAVGDNYDLRFLPGTLTVSPKPSGIAAILPMRMVDPGPAIRVAAPAVGGQGILFSGGDVDDGGEAAAGSQARSAQLVCATGEGCVTLPHPANRSLGTYLTVKAQ